VLTEQGKYVRAMSVLHKVYVVRESFKASTVFVMDQITGVLEKQGKLDEAMVMYRDILDRHNSYVRFKEQREECPSRSNDVVTTLTVEYDFLRLFYTGDCFFAHAELRHYPGSRTMCKVFASARFVGKYNLNKRSTLTNLVKYALDIATPINYKDRGDSVYRLL
jgi:hypothetical protein